VELLLQLGTITNCTVFAHIFYLSSEIKVKNEIYPEELPQNKLKNLQYSERLYQHTRYFDR